ncbi:hypothetical protein F4604DRAFT_1802717 [Suillus subluteus]|nr:hypothetical protein F4604DRAFT_1802717 [Suillus subluteus]
MGKKYYSSKFQKVAQTGNANKKHGSNKRGSCGGRNPEKRAKRFGRWGTVCDPVRLKDAQSCKAPHIHRIESFPSDFLNVPPSGKTVRETVAKHRYPNTAAELQALPDTGKILLPLDHLDPATIPADIPPNHNLIPPIQYESKLKGTLVEVHMAICHHRIKSSRRDIFNAILRELIVLAPPAAMPTSPFKRRRLHKGPATEQRNKGKTPIRG